MKNIFKNSLYLIARIVLVCMLSFMSIYLAGIASQIMYPVLAIFYYFVLMYFFVYTMLYEGDKDRNRVAIGSEKYRPYKGFLSAAIAIAPIILCFALQLIFVDMRGTVFMNIISVINAIFMMCAYYTVACVLYICNANSTQAESFKDVLFNTEALSDTMLVASTVSAVLITCMIGAGIGYLIGYKRIRIFKPIIEAIFKGRV